MAVFDLWICYAYIHLENFVFQEISGFRCFFGVQPWLKMYFKTIPKCCFNSTTKLKLRSKLKLSNWETAYLVLLAQSWASLALRWDIFAARSGRKHSGFDWSQPWRIHSLPWMKLCELCGSKTHWCEHRWSVDGGAKPNGNSPACRGPEERERRSKCGAAAQTDSSRCVFLGYRYRGQTLRLFREHKHYTHCF